LRPACWRGLRLGPRRRPPDGACGARAAQPRRRRPPRGAAGEEPPPPWRAAAVTPSKPARARPTERPPGTRRPLTRTRRATTQRITRAPVPEARPHLAGVPEGHPPAHERVPEALEDRTSQQREIKRARARLQDRVARRTQTRDNSRKADGGRETTRRGSSTESLLKQA
ncbi:unnamed protein product, partial [Prorocentrum cordatum]